MDTVQPVSPVFTSPAETGVTIDALIGPRIDDALRSLEGSSSLLAGMIRYHLGLVDREFQPVDPLSIDRGKRVRPAVALLAAGAAGGAPDVAAPAAAALELLHNFTLIHDDIQDESPTRRHRPTVWSIWGEKQAINAGDALFAAAHLPLYELPEYGTPPDLVFRLLAAFDRMTIAIVEGQTLDLGFEDRSDVTPAEYLEMITGKTAAILRFAAWAGALLGGVSDRDAEQWAEFGLALGLGFQIHDDLLGIWGESRETGKAPADDIRRRKKSYPILLLRERLSSAERDALQRLYDSSEISGDAVGRVLAMLDREGIRAETTREVARYHDEAARALREATSGTAEPNVFRNLLLALVERLAIRKG